MKLYLSSMPPTNKAAFSELLGSNANPSVAVIANAWDVYPAERKAAAVQDLLATFERFGFSCSFLDVTTADRKLVEAGLTGKQLVWLMGGNSFYLNFYLHKSGFSEVIRDFLEKGLVYGGESAGAVVAGTTLHGIEHADNPDKAPETIWDGLALFDRGIIPHWAWEKYEESIKAAKQEMERFDRVVAIENDKALVIDNGRERIVDNLLQQNQDCEL